jgi:hypothetical protein
MSIPLRPLPAPGARWWTGSRRDPMRLACRDGREHGGQREAHRLNCADVNLNCHILHELARINSDSFSFRFLFSVFSFPLLNEPSHVGYSLERSSFSFCCPLFA